MIRRDFDWSVHDGLLCTGCGERYAASNSHSRCEKCGQPLELELITNGGFDTVLRILA